MSTPSASWPAERHTPEETRQAFREDTKDLVAELRELLELPQLTDEQKRRIQSLTDSLAARWRQGSAGETDDRSAGEQLVSPRTNGVHAHKLYSGQDIKLL